MAAGHFRYVVSFISPWPPQVKSLRSKVVSKTRILEGQTPLRKSDKAGESAPLSALGAGQDGQDSSRGLPGPRQTKSGGRSPSRGILPGALSPLQLASPLPDIAWLPSPSTRICWSRLVHRTDSSLYYWPPTLAFSFSGLASQRQPNPLHGNERNLRYDVLAVPWGNRPRG